MALTAQQIVTLACQIAKTQGYTSQAGQFLNAILSDLCQTYNFDIAKGTFSFVFTTSLTPSATYPNIAAGCGPYALPADFLRMIDDKDAMWFLNGVPYPMIPCDLSEYDQLVQQAGNQAYPYIFATDMSQSPPNLVVWPGASGAYPCTIRYRKQMPDIATPETSTTVPWFPNQQFLITKTAGLLMQIAGDSRWQSFLGEGPDGAQGILRRYLNLKDDSSNRSQRVTLDRRRFGRASSTLPNTKRVGW